MVFARNSLDLLSTISFVTALMHMQIANLTAVMQAVPLAVALLSMIFLRERVGAGRIAAAMHPGLHRRPHDCQTVGVDVQCLRGFGPRHRLRRGVARYRHQTHSRPRIPTFVRDNRILAMQGSSPSAAPCYALFQGMQWPELWQFGLLALAAIFLSSGYLFMVATLRLSNLSGTAPFRYSIMVFAIVSGIVVFHEFPRLGLDARHGADRGHGPVCRAPRGTAQ